MYIYRISLHSCKDYLEINPSKPMNNILNGWSDKYSEVVGFCKSNKDLVLMSELKDMELEKLKGFQVVLIQNNGIPKTLSYTIKNIERVEL